MDLLFERNLSCPAEVAFSLLTDPERMNHWSTAKVRAGARGDGEHPAGIGAMRHVDLPARFGIDGSTLHEVAVESRPPTWFVYRVVNSPLIVRHRGEIEIIPTPKGCRLRWHVRATFVSDLVDHLAVRSLKRELGRSLDKLVHVSSSQSSATPPPIRTLEDDDDALSHFEERAQQCLAIQSQRATELQEKGDARWWFTRTYAHVTELQIAACRRGDYLHPTWVLRLIERFHHHYIHNLDHACSGEGTVEAHWERAFARMKRTENWGRSPFHSMGYAVFFGMKAHIEEDLPRAIAETYVEHYRERCSYARFRADYLTMAPVFREATERMFSDLAPADIPARTRLMRALIPAPIADLIRAKRYYDIAGERRRAFEHGASLVTLLLNSDQGTPAV